MIELTPELEAAIRHRDALVEQWRDLTQQMVEASHKVEELAGTGLKFDSEHLRR